MLGKYLGGTNEVWVKFTVNQSCYDDLGSYVPLENLLKALYPPPLRKARTKTFLFKPFGRSSGSPTQLELGLQVG